MAYVFRMTPPCAGPAEYIPVGFGFTAHAHVTDPALARAEATPQEALRRGGQYIHPPAFWNSELRHRENQRRKFAGWKFDAVPIPSTEKVD